MPTFNPQACQQRNRRAALRVGISAAPVTLGAVGGLSEADALARINAMRAGGAELKAADVHIRYAEAANANLIPSRAMFLHETTLRNIGDGAGEGVAFMNSHRTGGFSTESELPFGQTFWGQYGEGRASVGVFMLRSVHPNGANGPSTDDLAAMIDAGTLRDVSVGLYGGEALCDLCHANLNLEECPHAPGTTHSMSAEDQRQQRDRGVPDGSATYSLHNARFGEVSAVFDGAVPGAGFRKALALAAKGELSHTELTQARTAYVALARDNDFGEITPQHIHDLAHALHALWADDGEDEALTASAFSTHSHQALTTVEEYLARCERYDAMRESQGRNASPTRYAEWQALQQRLEALVARSAPKADPALLHALRVRHLQRQAKRRESALAGSH